MADFVPLDRAQNYAWQQRIANLRSQYTTGIGCSTSWPAATSAQRRRPNRTRLRAQISMTVGTIIGCRR
jgi:hypothetical protein